MDSYFRLNVRLLSIHEYYMPLIRVLCEKIAFCKTHEGRLRIIALYELHGDFSLQNLVDNRPSLTQFGLFAAVNLENKGIRADIFM